MKTDVNWKKWREYRIDLIEGTSPSHKIKENVGDASNALRDEFLSAGKRGISDKDIQLMLRTKLWIKRAGSKKALKDMWDNYSDPDYGFAYKKGDRWYALHV